MKAVYVIAGVLVVLAVVAIGAVLFLNSRSPQGPAPQSNTTRVRNTSVAVENATRDPQDDSPGEEIPNAPPAQDPLDDSPGEGNNPNIPPEASPPASGGMVSLPDTAWVQQASGERYEFCPDNRWQRSDENDTVTATGTFEQTTTTLVLSGDGDPKTYQITWDPAASVLAMQAGETTLNLDYDGASDCQ